MPFRRLLVVVFLCGCVATGPEPPAPPEGAPPGFPSDTYQATTTYGVESSLLTIHVYRDGRLKRLGHNHVISSTQLSGLVDRDGADLFLAVATLAVDDPALREAAGARFDTTPKPADIEATRRNLLGPKLLDAANPSVRPTDGHPAERDRVERSGCADSH